jgi:hypothetical protein
VDSIGVVGLVAGLWFALSPVGEQRRPPSAWLGWLLAGACTVLLLSGTLTEPLAPQDDSTVTTDWTTDQISDSHQPSGGFAGPGDSQIATAGPTTRAS